MTPINVVTALVVVDLLLVLVVLVLACVVSRQGEQLTDLREERDTAAVYARNLRADFDSVRAANYRLQQELHDVTVRCARAEQIIERFIPADLLKEAS